MEAQPKGQITLSRASTNLKQWQLLPTILRQNYKNPSTGVKRLL